MRAYAAIFLIALGARILLESASFRYVSTAQQRLWSWPFFLVFMTCLVLGALCAERSTRPATRDLRRWVLPLLTGLTVGLITIVTDIVSPVAVARGVASIHVGGWIAIPFYLYGAILISVVFHFLPIAAAAWTGRPALIVAACLLVAFSEDARYFISGQFVDIVETSRHALSVAANGAEAFFIYRYGLVAGLTQRLATYALWHIAWPLMST